METIVVQVGKSGFSEELIFNIKNHLKKKKNVNLKLLNGFLDSHEISRKEAFEQFKKQGFENFRIKLVGKVIFVENK